jgi:hypothetical protein
MPAEGAVKDAVRWLLSVGWQVRPNPILNNIRAVQLSLIYTVNGERYVDVLTLNYNAPSFLLHCVASYDPEFPFDHNVIWEKYLPVGEALRYAMELQQYLNQPAEQQQADPAHARQQRAEPAHARHEPVESEREAPEWFGLTPDQAQ